MGPSKQGKEKTLTWKDYERRKAREHRGKHIGGSGQPDYLRGNIHGEVKSWNKPLPKSVIMAEARKGRKEIISKKGFEDSAIKYAERYRPGLKLIHRNRIVKGRK